MTLASGGYVAADVAADVRTVAADSISCSVASMPLLGEHVEGQWTAG